MKLGIGGHAFANVGDDVSIDAFNVRIDVVSSGPSEADALRTRAPRRRRIFPTLPPPR